MVRGWAVQDLADYMSVEQQFVARLAWIVLHGDVLRASPRVAVAVVHPVEPSPTEQGWVEEPGRVGRTQDSAFGSTMEPRGVSSAGRAPALQAGGHRFDPGTLHSRRCCLRNF